MTLPAGVLTTDVNFASALTGLGSSVVAKLTVRLRCDGTPFIKYGPTGDIITRQPDSQVIPVGFSLPVAQVDQAGFFDSAGNAYTGWSYDADLEYAFNGETFLVHREFQTFAGQTSVNFLDLPGGTAGSPSAVAVPIIKTINGAGPDDAGNIDVGGGSGSAGIVVPFSNVSSLSTAHALGRIPQVSFRDTAGNPFFTDNTATSTVVTASFPGPTSGSMILT